jgi:hypothetical protein
MIACLIAGMLGCGGGPEILFFPCEASNQTTQNEQRSRLAALCRGAGIAEPEILADTLTLLLEGARVSRQAAGRKGPSAEFIRTAETVIKSFKAKKNFKRMQAPGKRNK